MLEWDLTKVMAIFEFVLELKISFKVFTLCDII